MKKIYLLIGFVLAMTCVKSQTIDTTVTFITACKIQPVKVNLTDTTFSTKIGVKSLGDNLQTAAQLYGCFLDQNNKIVHEFNYTLTGTEYEQFDGTATYLFNLFARKYALVFIKP